jgi:hypothetical protein
MGNGITRTLLENELECNKAMGNLKYNVRFLEDYIDKGRRLTPFIHSCR